MSKYAKEYWPFFLIVSIFFISSFNYLSLPSFGDEAWVYLPSIEYLYLNNITFLPGSLPPEFSRGHPLFFHSLYGIWVNVFGLSIFNSRVLSLFLTGLIAFYSYKIAKDFFNVKYAFVIPLILIIQPIVFIQSTLILPETLVSLLTIMVFYSFISNYRITYIVSASLLLLTKETGIILIISLIIFQIIEGLTLKTLNLQKSAIILSPLVFPVIFFIIQYATYDWIFFPDHISMLDFSLNNLLSNYCDYHEFLFEKSGRQFLFWGSAISIGLFWKHAPIWKNLISFLLFSTIFKVLFGYWVSIEILIIPICLLLVVVLYFQWFKPWNPENPKIKSFFLLSTIFIVLYVGFSSVNFFTYRYLLCLFPIMILSQFILINSESKYPIFSYLIVGLSVGVTVYFYNADDKIFDTNTNYKDAVLVERELIHYIENNINENECVTCGFLDHYTINYRITGHRKNKKIISTENYKSNYRCSYLLLKNFGDEIDSSTSLTGYNQVFSSKKGKASGLVLKKIIQ